MPEISEGRTIQSGFCGMSFGEKLIFNLLIIYIHLLCLAVTRKFAIGYTDNQRTHKNSNTDIQ